MNFKPAILGVISPWSPGHTPSLGQVDAEVEAVRVGVLLASAAVVGFQGAALFGAFGDDVRSVVTYITGGAAILGALLYVGAAAFPEMGRDFGTV